MLLLLFTVFWKLAILGKTTVSEDVPIFIWFEDVIWLFAPIAVDCVTEVILIISKFEIEIYFKLVQKCNNVQRIGKWCMDSILKTESLNSGISVQIEEKKEVWAQARYWLICFAKKLRWE